MIVKFWKESVKDSRGKVLIKEGWHYREIKTNKSIEEILKSKDEKNERLLKKALDTQRENTKLKQENKELRKGIKFISSLEPNRIMKEYIENLLNKTK
jgi:hypothetical protein